MPTLAELQSAMRAVSLGGDAAPLAGVIIGDGFSTQERLSIHRNNTTILLGESLGATFRIVKALVGDEFFANLTRQYIRTNPPTAPCLFEYGANFPEFLGHTPSLAELPYIEDVARLEWLWNESFHAPAAPVMTTADLGAIGADDLNALVLNPHPSLRLITSPYPLKQIWDLHQCDADPEALVNLDDGENHLVLVRSQLDVQIIELGAGGFTLASCLADGACLEDAFGAVEGIGDANEAPNALGLLIAAGAFQR
ncbi:MAG: DNA-binding domain-containing protein [Magnetovibrio sp.]|nr:DNA-binding domain-containing protein [Magnetovibrio sp.]